MAGLWDASQNGSPATHEGMVRFDETDNLLLKKCVHLGFRVIGIGCKERFPTADMRQAPEN